MNSDQHITTISIVSITYNHELFIEDALNSWLNQEIDFDFEIIIGDDCSQDKTVSIIQSYQKKFPNKIRLIANEINIGHQKNLLNTLIESRGKYIAICAGDDYWFDLSKLKKQVDVFLKNPQCKMVYTNCYFLFGHEQSKKKMVEYSENFSFELYEYLNQKYITIAPTSMIKRFDFRELQKSTFFKSTLEDEYIFTYTLKNGGQIFYLNEVTGYYRVHPKGINSQQKLVKQLYFKLSTMHNLKSEFKQDKKALTIINKFILEHIDRLYNYTFDGFHGLSRWSVFQLLIKYQPKILIDYRFYYNWFLKKKFGK
jgi:glycosyltransferase involved in cell wall biosynthesis